MKIIFTVGLSQANVLLALTSVRAINDVFFFLLVEPEEEGKPMSESSCLRIGGASNYS